VVHAQLPAFLEQYSKRDSLSTLSIQPVALAVEKGEGSHFHLLFGIPPFILDENAH
jgi:hypothetical protein